MTVLKFDLAQTAKLVEEITDADSFTPSFEDLYNPEYWKDGKILNKNGLQEHELPKGEFFSPDHNLMDKSKLKPSFFLVHDHGVYLMGNHCYNQKEGERATVVYAERMNPDIDDDWYEDARCAVGGDDFAITIPITWFDACLKKRSRTFRIKMGTKSISLG